MNKSLLWRGALILFVTAIMAATIWPPSEKIKQGLDLKGGIHMLLRVKVEDALRADRDKAIERLRQESQKGGGGELQVQPVSPVSFAVTAPAAGREKLDEIRGRHLAEWEIGSSEGRIVFRLSETERKRLSDLAVTQAVQTIENRVNAFGVAESTTQRQGFGDRIVVLLPGVEDPERIKRLLGQTAFLEFRIVEFPQSGAGAASEQEVLGSFNGQLPPHLEILPHDVKDEAGNVSATTYYAVQRLARVTGRDLKNARPGTGQFNDPVVEFTFTADGGERFAELTGSSVGKGLAIVLDRRVVSAPNIEERIKDSGIIKGQFTQQEVEDLSTVLRTGALPAGIEVLEERTVGASLGADSIEDGKRAGYLGAAMVVLMMLLVYHLSGMNAIVALALNVLMVFGGLAYFGAALTLPGIAGVVLTIGMAVDANVLVFERIREELKAGRTVRASVDEGFKRAFTSIIDTHLTTLIAALFLFQFGTGPVRGFAVTLGIGLTASLFTAVFVSRWLFDVELLARQRADTLSIG